MIKILVTTLLILTLSSCGNGGGSSPDSNSVTPQQSLSALVEIKNSTVSVENNDVSDVQSVINVMAPVQ